MKSKKILEVCFSPDLGGLELSVLDFYKALKVGAETFLCVKKESKLDSSLQDKNKIVLSQKNFLLRAFALAKIIDEKKIDIVHFHWTKDMLTVIIAKHFSKYKPKIVQSRHMRMTRFKSDFYHRWLYENIDVIHAVTNAVAKQLEQYIPKDIRPGIFMNYLGVKEPQVDKNRVEELKMKYHLNKSFVVGIIGRIEEPKGQYILLEAISQLKDLDIKCLIVGAFMDETYKQILLEKIEKLGIKERVIFSGFTQEVNEHINLFDVGVLATENETFGLVLIEMMINKITSIAINRGGPTEIIEDGIDGFLIERDSALLAQKIKSLYEKKDLKESISNNGYETVKKNFDFEKQMHKFYKGVIA